MSVNSELKSISGEGETLAGKTAIVTGASRGIGRAIAVKLASKGVSVMLTARDGGLLQEASAEIARIGASADSIALDLREPDAPSRLADHTIARFGGIDIVVNNAGATKRGEFMELADEDWADGFALKFFGAVRLIRAAWPSLRERRGAVLNIAGVGGRTPGAQFAIGGSVNAALLSLTKALAELGICDGIQVNAVNPGPVRTDRLARRLETLSKTHGISADEAAERMIREAGITRFGEPEDVANLVAFIVSPAGRWLQGALIDLDGGETKTI